MPTFTDRDFAEETLVELLCLLEPDAIARAFAKANPAGVFKLLFHDLLCGMPIDDVIDELNEVFGPDDLTVIRDGIE